MFFKTNFFLGGGGGLDGVIFKFFVCKNLYWGFSGFDLKKTLALMD